MFRQLLVLIVLMTCVFSVHPATANELSSLPPTIQLLSPLFQQAYLQEGRIYRSGQCGRNVKELIIELQNQGVDLSTSSVLFLLSESRQFVGGPILPGSLLPSMSRGNVPAWDFHVVLSVLDHLSNQTYILDLDGPARPVLMNQYFAEMFPSQIGMDRLRNIPVREIKTPKYLEAFETYYRTRDQSLSLDDNYVVGDFRKPHLAEFPVVDLRTFLDRQKPVKSGSNHSHP